MGERPSLRFQSLTIVLKVALTGFINSTSLLMMIDLSFIPLSL
jgi:hypothetical protein